VRFLWKYLIPILIGLTFGGVAAFDFPIGRALGLREIPMVRLGPGWQLDLIWVEASYLFSFLFLLLTTVLFLCLRLWESRIKLLLLLLILSPQVYSLSPENLESANFIVPIFLFVTILDLFMEERLNVSPIFFLILGLVAFMTLSVVNGKVPAFGEVIKGVKHLCFFFLVFLSLRNLPLLRFALKVLIVVSVFSAVIGIIQVVGYSATGSPVAVGFVTEDSRELLYESSGGSATFRAPAFFGVPGVFGGTMAPVGAIILFLILLKESRLFGQQWILLLMLPPILTGLYLCYNRPAYAAFALGAVLALYLARPSLSLHITALLLLLPVAALLLLSIASPRLFEEGTEKIREEVSSGDLRDRLILNQRALIGAFTKHPIAGVGMGQGKIYTEDYRRWPAHSVATQAAADIGIAGAAIYLSIFVVAFIRLLPAIGSRSGEHRDLAKVLLVGFIPLFFTMLNEPYFLKYPLSWIYVGLMESLTVLASRRTTA
jgi:hypothetical protein